MAIKKNKSTKKRGALATKSVGRIRGNATSCLTQQSAKPIRKSPKTVEKTVKYVGASTLTANSKYGEIRPEVREMTRRRLDKHAATWKELAKH